MITEAPAPSGSVPGAAQAVRQALDRVRMNQRGYARTRLRASPAVVTRARTDWGLAVLEWIEASVALAEAEDERDPARAASDSRSRRITVETGPVRGRIESSWQRYQQVRRNGGPDQIALARAQWREALVDWFQALAGQRAAEDGERARARTPDPEQAAPPVPEQAAPPDPEATSPRGQPRYRPLAAGWTPAKRTSGS